ncbi:MAG: tetratricopeptide repeat protein [Bacteroidales bacterium]|nr:tetratricopeptide repeat protein [Bacteroidales bacterium]
MVANAERLADTLPDSTIRLIDSILHMPVNFSERERMAMALLQAETFFGCKDGVHTVSTISPIMDNEFFDDHAFLSTSPELERAVAYYAKKKQYDKAALAALYSGFMQQHYNENEKAMCSFKEAEQYGSLVADSLTMAQAQYWMGKLLLDEGMEQEALTALIAADSSFGNHYANKSIVQNTIAVCYLIQGDIDNAETSLQQSLIFARKTGLDKVKRKTYNNYAVLYQIIGNYEQAVLYLQQIANEPNLDDDELLMININLGDIFIESNNVVDAAICYKKVDSLLPETQVKAETKVSAYRFLSLFAEKQGDLTSALRYREQHEIVVSQIFSERQELMIYNIQKRYDYEALQNTLNQKLSRTKSVMVLIVVLFFGVVILYLFRAVQRNKKEAETKANLLRFMNQNMELTQKQEATEKTQQDIARRLFDTQFKEALTMQKLSILLDNKSDVALLANLKQTVFNDKEPWDAILGLFDEMYPTLREKLQQQHPDLTEMELKDIILSYYNISRDEEALLLKKSVHTIDKWRNSVRKKMGNRS